MRLTPRQRWLIDYIEGQGQGQRGRWMHAFPKEKGRQLNRTIWSLQRHGILEQRTKLLPRSKWPKKRGPDRRITYGTVQFRINRRALKAHGL